MENYVPHILIIVGVFVAIWMILYFLPLGLWFSALLSGVKISFMELILMRFRRTPPALIVRALIKVHQGGVLLTREQLEAHYLAGGNVMKLVQGMVAAKIAGLKFNFKKASGADLQGVDLLETVKSELSKQKTT